LDFAIETKLPKHDSNVIKPRLNVITLMKRRLSTDIMQSV